MDKYQQLRTTGMRLANELIGKTVDEAKAMCQDVGFKIRFLSIDGRPCLITADCRMDRIGCRSVDGVITEAHVG